VSFNDEGICNVCERFDRYADRALDYFRNIDELSEIFRASRAAHPQAAFDCIALLSGGKDSTYALAQLVDMGLRVFAFTLDNGYLSEEAMVNIRRVVEHLGVRHEFGTTPAMREIFADSLKRHSNVCNGCFKTIYTLALKRADEMGVPIIVTGLSRGQFFETRLTPELFESESQPLATIDDTVLAARKAYHRVRDAVSKNIDTSFLRGGELLDEVRFVDFYRYSDVSLEAMLSYLDERLPWVRPADTGRSTNCLINDVGIHVHKTERGYHNYAWPYSWDVRVGHKERDEALDELNDAIDEKRVARILQEVGYRIRERSVGQATTSLTAYIVADEGFDEADYRDRLRKRLPVQAIPSSFVAVDAIPLTPNGKVDENRLRADGRQGKRVSRGQVTAPRNEIEQIVHTIWCELLGIPVVSTDTDFLDAGGNSILAIQVVARVSHAFDMDLPFAVAFQAPTIRDLAAVVESILMGELDHPTDAEA